METIKIEINHEAENLTASFGITKERFTEVFKSLYKKISKGDKSEQEHIYSLKKSVIIEGFIKDFNCGLISEKELIFFLYAADSLVEELLPIVSYEALKSDIMAWWNNLEKENKDFLLDISGLVHKKEELKEEDIKILFDFCYEVSTSF